MSTNRQMEGRLRDNFLHWQCILLNIICYRCERTLFSPSLFIHSGFLTHRELFRIHALVHSCGSIPRGLHWFEDPSHIVTPQRPSDINKSSNTMDTWLSGRSGGLRPSLEQMGLQKLQNGSHNWFPNLNLWTVFSLAPLPFAHYESHFLIVIVIHYSDKLNSLCSTTDGDVPQADSVPALLSFRCVSWDSTFKSPREVRPKFWLAILSHS